MTVDRRLEELSVRYGLPFAAARALRRLIALIADDPSAPTALRDPAVAVDAHVADALVALELAQVRA
ncbi:MAG TPA: hypothetical protein VG474_14620, partial [Solirubrobacteraceae bacterium]|nr:hypothetical protein [Solirubrobacteraceae bacterium]